MSPQNVVSQTPGDINAALSTLPLLNKATGRILMIKPNGKILIVESNGENAKIGSTLSSILADNQFDVQVVGTAQDAIEYLRTNDLDVVISDFDLTQYTGVELLQKIKIINPSIQVIIVSSRKEVKLAVDAMKKGAKDYVTKPVVPQTMLEIVRDCLEAKRRDGQAGKNGRSFFRNKEYIIGPSYQSQLVQKHIDLIAPTNMSAIIFGDTGTGKEYVARSIHAKSKRANEPFVAVDCGALPNELAASELFGHVKGAFTGAIKDKTGCFELANGGTLFLDEIGNLSYENQTHLLRVLQERIVKRVGSNKEVSIDVRVLVATNEDLREKVEEGEFREDVFHRLNEFKIEIPPLKDRQEDIDVFSQYFLKSANKQLNKGVASFSDETLQKIHGYSWPGNLRELNNVIKRAVLMSTSTEIKSSNLPREMRKASDETVGDVLVANSEKPKGLKEIAEQAEKNAILEVLKQTGYNKSKTAELLRVDRKTLYNKIRSLEIDID